MKKLQDLTADQVGRIVALYRVRGATPATISTVAETWAITESDARTLGTAATTTAPKRVVTESAPDLTAGVAAGDAQAARDAQAAHEARAAFLNAKLESQVQAAAAKPLADCSMQDLQALAAKAGADAGMFG